VAYWKISDALIRIKRLIVETVEVWNLRLSEAARKRDNDKRKDRTSYSDLESPTIPENKTLSETDISHAESASVGVAKKIKSLDQPEGDDSSVSSSPRCHQRSQSDGTVMSHNDDQADARKDSDKKSVKNILSQLLPSSTALTLIPVSCHAGERIRCKERVAESFQYPGPLHSTDRRLGPDRRVRRRAELDSCLLSQLLRLQEVLRGDNIEEEPCRADSQSCGQAQEPESGQERDQRRQSVRSVGLPPEQRLEERPQLPDKLFRFGLRSAGRRSRRQNRRREKVQESTYRSAVPGRPLQLLLPDLLRGEVRESEGASPAHRRRGLHQVAEQVGPVEREGRQVRLQLRQDRRRPLRPQGHVQVGSAVVPGVRPQLLRLHAQVLLDGTADAVGEDCGDLPGHLQEQLERLAQDQSAGDGEPLLQQDGLAEVRPEGVDEEQDGQSRQPRGRDRAARRESLEKWVCGFGFL
jgi:hypothetical protein